ncbi:MAG: pyruvate formate lyase-activating protein [Clostridia bacterium]|nr:pyruvate formate lyase-activating protein [Clostridia bacterium]
MVGRIHSKESFGTVDGPGIRYVLFMQGCPMRCLYCHNPDTWEVGGGTEITVDEIISEYKKNESFYKNGGITVTGGEPLLQVDFLIELFKTAKKKGIHTCIDSSGITFNPKNEDYIAKLDVLMQYVDLVMLDIKHIDPEKHIKLTAKDNANILGFAKYLDERNIPVWIRHVVVPGYTDDAVYHKKLGEFLATLHNVKALDVLPYHTMGAKKYDELGIKYPLAGVEALPKSEAVKAKSTIMEAFREARINSK